MTYGKQYLDDTTGFLLLGICALTTHMLVWRYAVVGGWALINADKVGSLLLILGALLWLVLVVLLQIASLLAVVFEIIIRV
jgi:hypothetical protein